MGGAARVAACKGCKNEEEKFIKNCDNFGVIWKFFGRLVLDQT
jgi:hypothetical protein